MEQEPKSITYGNSNTFISNLGFSYDDYVLLPSAARAATTDCAKANFNHSLLPISLLAFSVRTVAAALAAQLTYTISPAVHSSQRPLWLIYRCRGTKRRL